MQYLIYLSALELTKAHLLKSLSQRYNVKRSDEKMKGLFLKHGYFELTNFTR